MPARHPSEPAPPSSPNFKASSTILSTARFPARTSPSAPATPTSPSPPSPTANGAFAIPAVPLGDYIVTVTDPGFDTLQQTVTLAAGSSLILHLQLSIAAVNQSVTVLGTQDNANLDTVTPTTLIDRIDIAHTPGADRTNSLAMITDYVPGAYMTHDMLHMRGGHELSWLIDGVEIPNTNIASNIGPQIDPKDIDSLQVERGSYTADIGDRTYGVFNVVPRTGFERNREAELVLTAGNFYQTNDQLSFGDHTEKFAWYASLNGNRSNYGLQPAVSAPVHDAENGYGGFASLIYNRDPANQLRYITQLRTDFYQIPYDPDPNDWENQLYDSSGLRDGEHETDSYGAFTWLHTFSPNATAQISPFYHFNRANYQSSPSDQPASTTADETGFYSGLQASASTVIARNTLSGGLYGYAQHENDLFAAVFNDQSNPNFSVNPIITAGVEEAFVEDNYKPTSWLTLTGGERQSHFSGAITENAIYPRIGIALLIPKLNWVFRAFYGHFYQPPPLTSITGPALAFAQASGRHLRPPPWRAQRRASVRRPDSLPRLAARRRHLPDRSPQLPRPQQHRRIQHLHPHHRAGRADPGLGAHPPLAPPLALRPGPSRLLQPDRPADRRHHRRPHLQRSHPRSPPTPATSLTSTPRSTTTSATPSTSASTATFPVASSPPSTSTTAPASPTAIRIPPSPYSGPYLPSHTTADLALGKPSARRYTVSITAINVGNTRVLLDNSLTFGGFHYNDPRQLYAELRYRFKF